ncbi:MAG: hypothetical protein KF760_13200 [Candidatus Eremiobacteraeota bacterium]|nr:hypothetical protein [Candidatus Eremiobacteraeota bacterium]MCW5867023.1 hypothetical protein [Candidatus Eremiobacteraeota bacterium]
MNADRLGRFELMLTWSRKLQELSKVGECTRQLERFLKLVEALPGDEVGEIGIEWRRRRREQRPCLAMAYLVLTIVLVLVSGHFLGALFSALAATAVSLVAAQALHHHWKLEEEFDSELYARAAYVVNTPTWARQ